MRAITNLRFLHSFFFIIFLSINFVNPKSKGDTLESVIVLARHGARTPNHDDDPLKSVDPWQYDGSLTGVGMRQLYTLGRVIRILYIETEGGSLIPDNYDPKSVKVHASNT